MSDSIVFDVSSSKRSRSDPKDAFLDKSLDAIISENKPKKKEKMTKTEKIKKNAVKQISNPRNTNSFKKKQQRNDKIIKSNHGNERSVQMKSQRNNVNRSLIIKSNDRATLKMNTKNDKINRNIVIASPTKPKVVSQPIFIHKSFQNGDTQHKPETKQFKSYNTNPSNIRITVGGSTSDNKVARNAPKRQEKVSIFNRNVSHQDTTKRQISTQSSQKVTINNNGKSLSISERFSQRRN